MAGGDGPSVPKVEALQKRVSDLEILTTELRRTGKKPGNTIQINEVAPSTDEMEQLKEQMAAMRKEFELLKQQLTKSVKEFEKQIKFKADLNNLNELEKILMD